MFGNLEIKSKIFSLSSLSLASSAEISSPSLRISSKTGVTSLPSFLNAGIEAETLFLCAFMLSTEAMIDFFSSFHLSISVKSTVQPFLASFSAIRVGFSIIFLMSSIG